MISKPDNSHQRQQEQQRQRDDELDLDRSESPNLIIDLDEQRQTANPDHVAGDQSSVKQIYSAPKISPPITLLQEICSRNGFTPEYQLLSTEGSVHEPTFKIAVTVKDITVTASGQSKKKARHAAAREAIEKLRLRKNLNFDGINFDSMMAIDGNTSIDAPVVSSADGSNPESVGKSNYAIASSEANPVGKLQEICMKMRVNPPDYETCDEQGLAHERIFILSCKIASLNMTTLGNGRSKKLAKRQAAEHMLTKLESCELFDKPKTTSGNNGPSDILVNFSSLNMDLDDNANFVKSRSNFIELVRTIDSNVKYLWQEISMIETDNVNVDLFYELFLETFKITECLYRYRFDFVNDQNVLLKILDMDENVVMSALGNGKDNLIAMKKAVLEAYKIMIVLMEPLTGRDPHLNHRKVGC